MLNRYARATLLTGAILLGIGIIPMLIVSTLFPAANPVILGFAYLLLTPLGGIIFALGIILWLVAYFKR